MKKIIQKVTNYIFNNQFKKVPIYQIRSEIKEVSISEGWGGKQIQYFPIYKFYELYLSGNKKKAKEDMTAWYYNRFVVNKLYLVSKKQGGMLKGSLYKLVVREHDKQGIIINDELSNARDEIINDSIEKKVEQRFALLESIHNNGFYKTNKPLILHKENNLYYILSGHHRITSMAACGYKKVEAITNFNYLLKVVIKLKKKAES